MSETQSLQRLFLVPGICAAFCLPAILLAERFGWPQGPLHLTQFLAIVLCFPASVTYLWHTRGAPINSQRWVAVTAGVLSGLYLCTLVSLFFRLDFSGMD